MNHHKNGAVPDFVSHFVGAANIFASKLDFFSKPERTGIFVIFLILVLKLVLVTEILVLGILICNSVVFVLKSVILTKPVVLGVLF